MPTTAPTTSAWTPEGVVAVLTCLALVVIPAVIALLQAIKALRQAERANATSEANAERLTSVEQRVHENALATTPGPQTTWVPAVPTDKPKGS